MKIISLIGYSGSGKTHFIVKAIEMLKSEFNLNIIVIKNVHTHKLDIEGKDSYEFSKAGADFSIIKNKYNKLAVFFKKELEVNDIIDWILKLSNDIDLAFIEGFREEKYPGILCAKNIEDVIPQLNPNIKMISGLISVDNNTIKSEEGVPIINIEKNFHTFLEIFNIK